jgi:hypothetical protein
MRLPELPVLATVENCATYETIWAQLGGAEAQP